MAGEDFGEDVAEIGGEREVTTFEESLRLEAWPLAENRAAADRTAEDEHNVGVSLIRAASNPPSFT